MHLINLIVNYLYRKYGVPLHIFFSRNLIRGTSHLNELDNTCMYVGGLGLLDVNVCCSVVACFCEYFCLEHNYT